MNNENLDIDTKPWYKQFWPWFIISLPATSVVVSITFATIAFKNADDLVVDDYYKEGKAINQRTELMRNAYQFGYHARMERLEGNFVFVQFTNNQPESEVLNLSFVHPTDADKDFDMKIKRQSDGSFQGLAPSSTKGRWYLRLYQPDQWLIKTELVASSDTTDLKPTKT